MMTLKVTRTVAGALLIAVRLPACGKGRGRERRRLAAVWRELCKLINGLDRTKL
ncbi:hypothetical protein [Massilia aerilata]|uniref:ESPR domain-containing protein n=1 Tax=Massilia aerilata TaxID=453817 RepID=A0ABW0RZ88_9BURK